MRMEKRYRHSVERKNAPYRGVSENGDFVNTSLEVLHDMLELALVSGDQGHAEELRGRMRVLVAGEDGDIRSNLAQVGRICKTEVVDVPMDLTTWSRHGGVSVTSTADGYELSEQGLLDPAGITWNVDVEAGDELLVSMKARALSGKTDEVMLGATRINLGQESLEKIDVGGISSGVYVDKRLYCQQRETVELGVFLHRLPDTLAAGSIVIEELTVHRILSGEVTMKGIETESKTEMRDIRETLDSLRK